MTKKRKIEDVIIGYNDKTLDEGVLTALGIKVAKDSPLFRERAIEQLEKRLRLSKKLNKQWIFFLLGLGLILILGKFFSDQICTALFFQKFYKKNG